MLRLRDWFGDGSAPVPGARERAHNVLDTFTIDGELSMSYRVCTVQCPTDARLGPAGPVPETPRLVDLLHNRGHLRPVVVEG